MISPPLDPRLRQIVNGRKANFDLIEKVEFERPERNYS